MSNVITVPQRLPKLSWENTKPIQKRSGKMPVKQFCTNTDVKTFSCNGIKGKK